MVIAQNSTEITTTKIEAALGIFVDPNMTNCMAKVLAFACKTRNVSYEKVENLVGHYAEDVMLSGWEWRLLIPVRTLRCHEWDDRVLLAQDGEVYEMPNVSRFLVENACHTGQWNTSFAVSEFFRVSGEMQWREMPALVKRIKEGCPADGINAKQIQVACREKGFGNRVDTMIAILKGAGIISPKLGSLARVARTGTPLYEINPCLFIELCSSKTGLRI